jgi:hypothetical protein
MRPLRGAVMSKLILSRLVLQAVCGAGMAHGAVLNRESLCTHAGGACRSVHASHLGRLFALSLRKKW